MVLGIKRRGQPRAKVKWPVQIQTTRGSIYGVTTNISTSGAHIFCQEPSQVEGKLRLTIEVPHRRSLIIVAMVVWQTVSTPNESSSGFGIGVKFAHISADDRQLLQSLLAKHFERN
ncbi:MAG: PilZ domain-containing protein [Deltaproteobacteria bacterium]|nr:MAG: PilZ domain-containing protein [Deltaproteobacteria bacterium]